MPATTMKTTSTGGGANGEMSPEVKTYYDRNLLSRLLPQLVFLNFGQIRPMPSREGQTVNFRRFSSLPLATTALSEGVTPNGDVLNVSQITASPAQYGSFVEISDVLDFTAPDPILTETGALLAEQAAQTIDAVVREGIKAGTSLQYAAGRASRVTVAATDKINKAEIQKVVRTLVTNKAKKITSILNASTGVGTKPVAAGYVAIIGPATLYDLKQDSAWVPVEQYGSHMQLLPFEVGALDEVRFVLSHQSLVFAGQGATGIDVHGTLIFGQDAFGVVAPMGVENIIKPFGAGNDPLNQRATSGWKAFLVSKILQDLAIIRLEHAVTP